MLEECVASKMFNNRMHGGGLGEEKNITLLFIVICQHSKIEDLLKVSLQTVSFPVCTVNVPKSVIILARLKVVMSICCRHGENVRFE